MGAIMVKPPGSAGCSGKARAVGQTELSCMRSSSADDTWKGGIEDRGMHDVTAISEIAVEAIVAGASIVATCKVERAEDQIKTLASAD
jgi:hypothetical protein